MRRVLGVGVTVMIASLLVSVSLPLVLVAAADQPDGGRDRDTGNSSGPGAWGGWSNGQIPLDAMCPVAWSSGQYLRCDALESLTALNDLYRARFSANICVTDSYRDLASQVRLKSAKGAYAATPGTSNHGWGLALDLCGGINDFGTATHTWMRDNAPTAGWENPAWAHDASGVEEPWHWEYQGTRSNPG